MLSHALSALTARRNAVKEGEKGFTLIELLVVVIIIGILAAIAIPVYLGIQNNAKDSAVKSDVSSLKTAVVAYETDNNSLPPGVDSTSLGSHAVSLSSDTTSAKFNSATSTTFCVTALSTTGKTFYATDSTGVAEYTTLPTGCTAP